MEEDHYYYDDGISRERVKDMPRSTAWKNNVHFCQNPACPNDHVIKIAVFMNSGICSVDCKKALGLDVSSVGTMMFVTADERKKIMEARHG